MNDLTRYQKVILTALKIHQLNYQLKNEMTELSKLLFTQELKTREFDDQIARDALLSLQSDQLITIVPNKHVDSQLKYGDCEFSLYCEPHEVDGTFITEILKQISITQLLK